jgi:hypothetical protein
MVKEIKPPSAEIYKLRGVDRSAPRDIEEVRNNLLKLANDIDRIADKTRWPGWCKCQADSMRDFANNLKSP